MSTQIQAAIEAAKNAAGQLATASQEIVTYQQPAAPAPARALTLNDLMMGSFRPDKWIRVTAFGFFINPDRRTPLKSLDVSIDLSAVLYCQRITYGNPAEYRATYDNVNDSRGGLWVNTVAQAKQVDQRAYVYRSADVPFTMLADVKDSDGQILIEKGQVLGWGPSATAWNGWTDLVRELANKGIDPEKATVKVTVEHKYNKNAKGEWGTLVFKNPEVVSH